MKKTLMLASLVLLPFLVAACLDGITNSEEKDGSGVLLVHLETAGQDLDPDGYALNVDGKQAISAAPDETVKLEGVAAGTYKLRLINIAANCGTPDNPREISVAEDDTTETSFRVSCLQQMKNRVIFSSNREGDTDIYGINPDGTGMKRLTDDASDNWTSAISNDGTRIAFTGTSNGNGTLNVLTVQDGSVRLAAQLDNDIGGLAWSPKDSSLVFVSQPVGEQDTELFTIRADGSGLTRLTDNPYDDDNPDWSPDGENIVFDRSTVTADDPAADLSDGIENHIHTIQPDGDGERQLTDNGLNNHDPAWSPDGNEILIHRDGSFQKTELFVLNTDGTELRRITENNLFDRYADWSPDGSQVVFVRYNSEGNFNNTIFRMNSDGSGTATALSSHIEDDYNPAWSPVE